MKGREGGGKDAFPGEKEEGMDEFVTRVRAALNIRFQGSTAPQNFFTDRGNGFFNSGSGAITPTYRCALREHGLKAFFSEDASVQPGKLQEVMLHETAVAWMRRRLSQTKPAWPWVETLDSYRSRLKACAAYINNKYDVDGLCMALPRRLSLLEQSWGDRISK